MSVTRLCGWVPMPVKWMIWKQLSATLSHWCGWTMCFSFDTSWFKQIETQMMCDKVKLWMSHYLVFCVAVLFLQRNSRRVGWGWGQTFSSPPECFHSAEQSWFCWWWSPPRPAARCLLVAWWLHIPPGCGWSGWGWTGSWTVHRKLNRWKAGQPHCQMSCKCLITTKVNLLINARPWLKTWPNSVICFCFSCQRCNQQYYPFNNQFRTQ